MAELKAGGLAIIISCPWSMNVGKVVKVAKYLGITKSSFSDEEAPCWGCYCDSLIETPYGSSYQAGIFTRRLLPIDGDDFQREDDRQKELTHG